MNKPWKMRKPQPARWPRYTVVDADGVVLVEVPINAQKSDIGGANYLTAAIAHLPQLLHACTGVLEATDAGDIEFKQKLRDVMAQIQQQALK